MDQIRSCLVKHSFCLVFNFFWWRVFFSFFIRFLDFVLIFDFFVPLHNFFEVFYFLLCNSEFVLKPYLTQFLKNQDH